MSLRNHDLTRTRALVLGGCVALLVAAGTMVVEKVTTPVQDTFFRNNTKGTVTVSSAAGCRQYSFDNKTGYLVADRGPDCGGEGAGPGRVRVREDDGPDSFVSIKRALTGR